MYVCLYVYRWVGCSLEDDDYDLTAGCRADYLHREMYLHEWHGHASEISWRYTFFAFH